MCSSCAAPSHQRRPPHRRRQARAGGALQRREKGMASQAARDVSPAIAVLAVEGEALDMTVNASEAMRAMAAAVREQGKSKAPVVVDAKVRAPVAPRRS